MLDFEQKYTPSKKKSSKHGATNNDDLGDVDIHVFNQRTFIIPINMDVIEGKPKNDKDKDYQKCKKIEVKNTVCALRNSGGGVLIIKTEGTSEASYRNKFHKVFDSMFNLYVFENEMFNNVYEFQETKIKDNLLIFVQGSSRIVTTETNTRVPIPRGTDLISAQRLFNLFPLKTWKRSSIQSRWTPTNHKKHYPYEESTDIQFKSYREVSDFEHIKHRMQEDIRNYVSAFTKVKNGGSIFFGIEEIPTESKSNTTPVASGLKIPLNDDKISDLKEFCREIITERMCWLSRDNSSNADYKTLMPKSVEKCYKIEFHLLSGNGESKRVIELSVAHFEGIVFQSNEGPTAWEFNENEELCKISLDKWYSLMNKGKY